MSDAFDRRQSATKSDLEALKEYVLMMFGERDKALITTAAGLSTKLESMNQFRQQLSDQAATFVRRSEHDELSRQVVAMQVTTQDQIGDCAQRVELVSLRDEFNRAVVARTAQMDRMEQSQVAMQARYALISVIIGFVLSALGVWAAWGGPHHG